MATASRSSFLRVSYAEDSALVNTPFRRFWLAAGIAIALAAPLAISSFVLHLLNLVLISLIAALALNLLTGYSGQISLGHASLLAAGAFTAAAMHLSLGAPTLLAFPASLVVGSVLGLLIGLPSLRFRGLYLAVTTLAMHYAITHLARFYQAQVARNAGIALPDPAIGSLELSSDLAWYYVLLILAFLALVALLNLLRTGSGRAWMAVRDRDVAAEALGIDLMRTKLSAFIVSSAVTALAGALYAYYTNVVTVEEYTLELSIAYLAMIIVGGLGSVLGTVLGTAFIVLLPYGIEWAFELLPVPSSIRTEIFGIQFGVYGLFILLFLVFEPKGLAEIWRRIRVYFELWPFRYRPVDTVRR